MTVTHSRAEPFLSVRRASSADVRKRDLVFPPRVQGAESLHLVPISVLSDSKVRRTLPTQKKMFAYPARRANNVCENAPPCCDTGARARRTIVYCHIRLLA